MKVVDANVLLYAVDRAAPRHRVAKAWLDGALASPEPVGFAWVVLLAFIRLSTRREVSARPLTIEQACAVVEAWLSQPAAVVLSPTHRHLSLLCGLLSPLGAGGNLVNDAHLATLALEHGAEVVSFDNDFGRFMGVAWRQPS